MPRLTKEPWFGPKRYVGWGWAPASWQGWLATGLMVALVIAALRILRLPLGPPVAAVVVLVFLALAALTGTKPGGPGL